MRRYRPLQDDAQSIGIVIYLDKPALAFILRQIGWPVLFIKRQSDNGSGTRLTANIDGYFLNIANTD